MPDTGVYSRRGFGMSLQKEQFVAAANAPYCPGAQSAHTDAAAATEYLPAGHFVQTAPLDAPVTFE
jgi:hypothetical protein